jgi:hypothetical protein
MLVGMGIAPDVLDFFVKNAKFRLCLPKDPT